MHFSCVCEFGCLQPCQDSSFMVHNLTNKSYVTVVQAILLAHVISVSESVQMQECHPTWSFHSRKAEKSQGMQ
jgi:hypothetical protein